MALTEKAALNKDTNYSVPAMQHRHFAFIAAVIKRLPSSEARLEAATAFAGALRASNTAFDAERFWRAAGFTGITHWDEFIKA